jgi:hypothetical protein
LTFAAGLGIRGEASSLRRGEQTRSQHHSNSNLHDWMLTTLKMMDSIAALRVQDFVVSNRNFQSCLHACMRAVYMHNFF